MKRFLMVAVIVMALTLVGFAAALAAMGWFICDQQGAIVSGPYDSVETCNSVKEHMPNKVRYTCRYRWYNG